VSGTDLLCQGIKDLSSSAHLPSLKRESSGSRSFEAVHAGFEGGDVGFERSDALIELRKREAHERSHFFEFVPEFAPQILQFVPNCRVAFRDLTDITP